MEKKSEKRKRIVINEELNYKMRGGSSCAMQCNVMLPAHICKSTPTRNLEFDLDKICMHRGIQSFISSICICCACEPRHFM